MGQRNRSGEKHQHSVFKHNHITNPTVTPADAIVHAAKELTEALKGNVPGSLREISLEELERVEQIFAQKA